MSTGNIFISYRRDDASGYARAICDRLVARFSKERIFMDVDGIEPGLPFDKIISEAVGRCEVLLAIVGKRWLEPREGGVPRISAADDFVRLEIAAALSRDIRVIPVLVDDAVMPSEKALPDDLRAFARRNAIEIGNSRFNSDVDRLIETVGHVIGTPVARGALRQSRRTLLGTAILGLGGLSAAAFVGFHLLGDSGTPASGQPDWRFCQKCHALFFDEYAAKGVCAAGGGHLAQGFNFVLLHDVPDPGQRDWRFCQKCHVMFFDGHPAKGVCSAGGGHSAAGFNFVLPHNTATSGQPGWRYCRKCQSMFFDGFDAKGRCPAGDAHAAEGFNFVLPYTT